ncbi:MAG: copper chaperone PCu(A)C [Gammaproteobacteria bacterium]|nr:copper chaperone PCu(A)C [Gammaproteobacteria bacterium]
MKRFLLIVLLWPLAAVAEVEVRDAWIKQLPPTVPMRAGYLTLYNRGDSTMLLTGASSDVFERVEIHRSYEQDGMMRMDPVDSIELPANTEFRLAPGGYHLMMMMPRETTRAGDRVGLVLEFSDGSRQSLQMTVKK